MNVALIHYWLVGMRGGERVLESLCRLYPQAHVYTHACNAAALSRTLASRRISTTFVGKLPGSARLYKYYLPLMPLALEQIDLSAYDLVISSESGPAKGVLTRADCPHLCYCHTPMRYLWDFYPDYLASASALTRLCMRPVFHRLRQWDVLSAQRVDHFVANSRTVARRIARHWRREASVVPPPVDAENIPPGEERREPFYLCLGQLVPYKRVDLAIRACAALHLPLVVAGEGSERRRLEALAQALNAGTRFVGRVDDAEKLRLLRTCTALIFPGEEDFGIVPVEAMAAGTPVIAYGRGGATETVIPDVTGLLFPDQGVDALVQCLQTFAAHTRDFDPVRLRAHALSFGEERFLNAMRREIAVAQSTVR